LIAVGLVSGAVSLTSATTARSAGQTIHFDVQFNETALDLGTPGPSPGDEFILHDLLFSDGKQVGHNGGVCVLTDPTAPEIACTATFSLPDGTITTQFLTTPPPNKVFAVTGGTGIYRNVRGDGTLVENGNGTGEITFHLIG